ncbi:sensor histidine kinase [Nocardia gamkensis]|uniref:sensor histidine kinase n=1 Tax=Nocardia gamkensis TaxID=352869 RepID=UPI0037CCC2C5
MAQLFSRRGACAAARKADQRVHAKLNPRRSESVRSDRRRLGFRSSSSIRNRVLAIALTPSAALLVTGIIVVTQLASEARSAQEWFDFRSAAAEPALHFITAIERERSTSLQVFGGDPQAAAELGPRRADTDTALAELNQVAVAGKRLDADSIAQSATTFAQLAPQMPTIRQSIDRGQIDVQDVDAYYSRLVGVIGDSVLESAVPNAPDSETLAQEFISATLVQIADLQSRAKGLAASGMAREVLDPAKRRLVAELNGAFRQQLEALVPRLAKPSQADYRGLIDSPEWRLATLARDELTERGKTSVSYQDWLAAEQAVGTGLLGLFRSQLSRTFQTANDAAAESFARSVWAGVIGLFLTLSAFAIAAVLANRLVARLRSLRSRSLEMANEKLPSIIKRINDGEDVDLDAETLLVDTGGDEIGQVAEAFSKAQRTAVDAAVEEVRTRSGFNKVFLDIAYRNQAIVRRQLELLDVAESKQDDPEHLQLLFDLDHLATRARRNAENLLILGGGQPGRRWRRPVPLEEIVRGAVSETENFARVGTVHVPDVWVAGGAVADLIHLLAELIDNATTFSPPEAPVSVLGNLVGRGVVVQVEDQGLGIRFEERERLNEMLGEPPDFHEMALEGRRHLGLFVVGRLAQQHSITVSLQESAYGGIKSIVLLPTELLQAANQTSAGHTVGNSGPIEPHERRVEGPAATGPVAREFGHVTSTGQAFPATDAEFGNAPPFAGTSSFNSPLPTDRQPELPATKGRAPLPRRHRQSHLAPELQQLDNSALHLSRNTSDRQRSPDVMRGSLASFQRGTRQGRASAPNSNE